MSHHLPSPAPSPFPGAPQAPRDASAIRTDLESQLKRLIQDLWEVEICAGEVLPGREDAVPEHLAKVNAALVELTKLAPHVTDSVPRTIVEHVEKYKNPHLSTKTMLSRATGENQYTLGRNLGLESFRRQLEEGLGQAFPDVELPERKHKPVGVAEGPEDQREPDANGDGVATSTQEPLNSQEGDGLDPTAANEEPAQAVQGDDLASGAQGEALPAAAEASTGPEADQQEQPQASDSMAVDQA